MDYAIGVICHFRVKKIKLIKRYITTIITHKRCNIYFYLIFLACTLTLHSCYSKFSFLRVYFAFAKAAATTAASTAPSAASLLFRSLRLESIHTERDSSIRASLLFRCHSCCCSCLHCCHNSVHVHATS